MPERAFVYLCGSLLFARDHYQRQAAFFSVGKNRTSSLLACAQTDMSAMTQRAFVNFRFRGEIPLDEDQRQTAGMILHNCDTCLVFHKNASQEMIAENKQDQGQKCKRLCAFPSLAAASVGFFYRYG